MSLKLATLGYLGNPSFGCSQEFWDNLQANPAAEELLLMSEHPWPGCLQLKGSPDQFRGAPFTAGPDEGKPNPFGPNNVVFLTACKIAFDRGISHMLYLETDCRVLGKGWDRQIWDEYFDLGRPLICAGSLACYNPASYSLEAARRWERLVSTNTKRNFPIPTYGWLPAATKAPSCVFPNGALAIYDINWMRQLFNLDDPVGCGIANSAFDLVLGTLIWQRFQEDSYEVVGLLNSVLSLYGDVLTTEAERLQWLREGRYAAVHQIKGKVNP